MSRDLHIFASPRLRVPASPCPPTSASPRPRVLSPPRSRVFASLLAGVFCLLLLAGSSAAAERQYVYVPIEDLSVLLSAQKGVLLTRTELEELWRQAYPDGQPKKPAVDEVFLTGGNYIGAVVGDALQITGELQLTKREAGWQSVLLPLGGVAIASAQLNGEPAKIGLDTKGRPQLFLRQPGEHRLRLELTAPLTRTKARQTGQFRLPPAPGELRMELPKGQQVRVVDARMPLGDPQKNQFRIPLGGRDALTFTIESTAEAGRREPLILARTESVLTLTPSQADWQEALQVQTHARPVDTLQIRVPASLQVVGVTSPGLARWERIEQAEAAQLTLRYESAWSGQRQVDVKALGVAPLGEPWQLPHLAVVDAAVQTGRLRVSIDESLDFELRRLLAAQRLSPDNPNEQTLHLAYWRSDYQAELVVRPKVRQLAASVVTLVNVDRHRLELTASATIEPRHGALFELPVSLSKGWQVLAVEVAGAKVPFQAMPRQDRILLPIRLSQPVLADQSIEVTVRAEQTPGNWLDQPAVPAAIPLTSLEIGGASEVEGMILLRSPEEIRLSTLDLAGLESVPTAGVPGADDKVRFALQYRNGAAIAGKLEASLRPARIVARADAAVHLTKTHLVAQYLVRYQVTGGATNTLAFELADVQENQVQVRVAREGASGVHFVKQSTSVTAAGKHRWELSFEQPIRGPVALIVEIQRPRDEEEAVSLPVLSVPDAVRQAGTLAVYGASEQEVRVTAQDLRPIDPAELPGLAEYQPSGRLVASFQYREVPYSLALVVSTHPEVEVLAGICIHAQIRSVVDTSGLIRSEASYTVQNVGVQHLRVRLPERSELLSAMIAGIPQEVRGGGGEYLVALPTAVQGAAEARIVLHYQGVIDNVAMAGQLRQQPPLLNLNVLQLDWTVYLPDETLVVHSTGSIRPKEPLERFSLIGALRRALTPGGGRRFFNPLDLLPMAGAPRAEVDYAMSPDSSARPATNSVPTPSVQTNRGRGEVNVNGPPMKVLQERILGTTDKEESPAFEALMDNMMGMAADKRKSGDVATKSQAEPGAKPKTPEDMQRMAQMSMMSGNEAMLEELAGYDMSGRWRKGQGDAMHRDRYGFSGSNRQGLLSVPMAFQPIGRPFEFRGQAGGGELAVSLQNDRFCRLLAACVALGLILVGWLWRECRTRTKAVVIATLLSLAVGLSGLVPLSQVFWLDGLLLGAVGIWLLYIARSVGLWLAGLRWGRAASLGTVLVFVMAVSRAGAGEPKQTEAPAPAKPQVPAFQSNLPRIYIPYVAGEDPLQSQQVYLPKEDYERLWNAAHPDQVILPDPAVTGLATEVSYKGRIDGKVAKFDLAMTLWSFRDDWVGVRIPIAGVVFGKLSLDGKPAALAAPSASPPAKSSGNKARAKQRAAPAPVFPTVYVRGRGSHQLVASFEMPVQRLGPTGELELQLAGCGSAQLELMLPANGLAIKTEGLTGGWQLADERFLAAVSSGGRIVVRWQPVSARRDAELLASVTQDTRIDVGHGGLRRRSRLTYLIRQGTANSFSIRVPEPVRVVSVSGEVVADWALQGTGAERKLLVQTPRPVSGKVSLQLDLLLPITLPDAGVEALQITFPQIVPLDISRETGTLAIAADSGLDVGVRSTTGCQRIGRDSFYGPAPAESNDLPPLLAAYRYASRPCSLLLSVADRSAKRTSSINSSVIIERERLRLKSHVAITQTRTALVTTRLRLPAGFVIEAVDVPENACWRALIEAAGQVIEIEQAGLESERVVDRSGLDVRVEGWVPRDPAQATVRIPRIEVLAADRQVGHTAIFLIPGLAAETQKLEGLLPIDRAQLPSELQSARVGVAQTQVPPSLAFRQESADVELVLGLRVLQPRLRATVATTVSVREVALATIARLQWKIERAGVRHFSFTAPAWLGEDLDIAGPAIRQTESSLLARGRRVFRISLDREVFDDYALCVAQIMPLPEDGLVRAPMLLPQGVEATSSFVLLENQSPDQLDRVEDPNLRFEQLDSEQVPAELAEPLRQSAIEVLRMISTEGEPTWHMRSSEKIAALSASVNLVDLMMVVDESGGYRARANYRVANRNEQFLALAFPEDAQVWSVFVAGLPSRPATGTREGKAVVLIPLPKTAAGDFSCFVQVVYTGHLECTRGWWPRWSFPSPEVVGLPVGEVQWTLHLPQSYNYSSFRGTLEESEPSYLLFNRQATKFAEARQLLSQARFGKGSSRSRAFSNLMTLSLGDIESGPVAGEKTRRLQQQVQSEAQQLQRAVDEIRQKPIPSPADANRIELDQYFAPFSLPPSTTAPDDSGSGQPRASGRRVVSPKAEPQAGKKVVPRRGEPQAVRSRLQQRLQSQVEVLNLQQQAPAPSQTSSQEQNADRTAAPSRPQTQPVPQQAQEVDLDHALPEPAPDQPIAGAAMTRAGGLSLPIELPTEGRRFCFVTARGKPSLSMLVSPAEAGQWGAGALWLLLCLSVGLCSVLVASRWQLVPAFMRHWRTFLVLVGLIWWLTLPLSALGFLCMLLGLFSAGASICRRLTRKATEPQPG